MKRDTPNHQNTSPSVDASASHYTFGDNDLAARRLTLLARVFDPASRDVLQTWAPERPALAVDLGCGPGATTVLLHEVSRAASTLGLELSEKHLARARSSGFEGVGFERHDLREMPYRFGPAQLVFARFLLTHLPDPGAVLDAASDRLAPGGRCVVQETANMQSDHPTLRRYYELVYELQQRAGQAMFIGRELGALARARATAERRVLHAAERIYDVDARSMAELHWMNLRTWREDPVARGAFDPNELDHLDASLAQIVSGATPAGVVSVALGELVIERT